MKAKLLYCHQLGLFQPDQIQAFLSFACECFTSNCMVTLPLYSLANIQTSQNMTQRHLPEPLGFTHDFGAYVALNCNISKLICRVFPLANVTVGSGSEWLEQCFFLPVPWHKMAIVYLWRG